MSQEFDVATIGKDYQWGFADPEHPVYKAQKGLNREVVEAISHLKNEPEWMLEFRLHALEVFQSKPMPTWGADLAGLDLEDIYYYAKPPTNQAKSWEDRCGGSRSRRAR